MRQQLCLVLVLCLLKNSIAEDGVPICLEENLSSRVGNEDIAEEDANFFTYQGARVSKSCLNDKLSKVRLTPIDEIQENIGKLNIGELNLGIAYTAEAIQAHEDGFAYEVKIRYHDDRDNQIVSDPLNCVDWRIYQTVNEYEIDMTRKYVTVEGDVPSWPVSSYTFNTVADAAEITFRITQADLDTHQCIKFEENGKVAWDCFFEMAFVLKGVTQISYYLCIKICIDLNVTAAVPEVNFVKIIQIDRCSPEGVCTVNVNVNSGLYFCSDLTCENISKTPFFVLFLNRPFWMRYQIDDLAFQTLYIDNVTLTFQALGFKLTCDQTEYKILSHNPGFNIMQLRVPIVASQVLISVQGQLSPTATRLLEETTDGQTLNAPASAGAQFVEPFVQTMNDANQKLQEFQNSAGYMIAFGTLIVSIIMY